MTAVPASTMHSRSIKIDKVKDLVLNLLIPVLVGLVSGNNRKQAFLAPYFYSPTRPQPFHEMFISNAKCHCRNDTFTDLLIMLLLIIMPRIS